MGFSQIIENLPIYYNYYVSNSIDEIRLKAFWGNVDVESVGFLFDSLNNLVFGETSQDNICDVAPRSHPTRLEVLLQGYNLFGVFSFVAEECGGGTGVIWHAAHFLAPV